MIQRMVMTLLFQIPPVLLVAALAVLWKDSLIYRPPVKCSIT
jgi:hypothetical protein